MGRQWPLPAGTYRVTSRFAGRVNPVTGKPENHSGVDLAAPDGTPFYACAGGTVKYLGAATGYGQWIVVDSPDADGGGCWEYGHMWNAHATGLKIGQRVEAGQLLGYIGSNGQSTGPHLHLTLWERGYGGRRVDPETGLAGCPHPPVGGGKASSTAPGGAAPVPAPAGTLYGIDVSEFQDGLNLAGTGADFCVIRLAYGSKKADRCAVSHTQDWKTTGKPTAFYHYLTPWDPIAAQADLATRVWSDCGRLGGVWIDVEEPGLTRAMVVAFRDALRARGVHVIGSYSRANFWEALPGGEPKADEGGGAIWVSHYGARPSGPLRTAYPGDNGSVWLYPLGDRRPDLWQFTDRATVPGWSRGVDGNAYRGTVDGLRALFTGTAPGKDEDDMFTDEDRALLRSVAKESRLGTDQTAGPGRGKDGERTYDGWDLRSVLTAARRKKFLGLTVPEMLAVLLVGTTDDVAAVRAVVNPEGK